MLKKNGGDPPAQQFRGPKLVRIDPSQILDAAQRVFARNGVDGSSVRAIAREAKCDPSLLYYHFLNKDDIFAVILERKFDRLIPDLESIASAYDAQTQGGARRAVRNAEGRTPLQEALWQTLQVFHRHVKDDAGFRGMIRGNVATDQTFVRSEMLKYISRIIQTIRKYLNGGVESGELRGDVNLDAATFFFIRTSIDIFDFFPVFAPKLLAMPLDEAIDLAERQWFQLFWAGMENGPRQSGLQGSAPDASGVQGSAPDVMRKKPSRRRETEVNRP